MKHAAQSGILERIIDPDGATLSPDAARALLDLAFKPQDVRRLAELSEKAQLGTLAADEADELDDYVHLSHFLAIVKSKARRSLKASDAVRTDAEWNLSL